MNSCATGRTPNLHWSHTLQATRSEGSVRVRFAEGQATLEGRGGLAQLDLHRHTFTTRFDGGFWLRQSLRLVDLVTRLEAGHLPAHASAVERRGRCVLFAGRSDAGKSTAASLAVEAGWTRLQDDLSFLHEGRLQEAVDWSAQGGRRPQGGCPVAGIVILEQAREDRLSLLSPREAVARMGPLWGPPAPLPMDQWLTRLGRELRLVNVYEMRFRKSPSCMRVLDGIPRPSRP